MKSGSISALCAAMLVSLFAFSAFAAKFQGQVYGCWAEKTGGQIVYVDNEGDPCCGLECAETWQKDKEAFGFGNGYGDGFAIPVTITPGESFTAEILHGTTTAAHVDTPIIFTDKEMMDRFHEGECDWWRMTGGTDIWASGPVSTRAWVVVWLNAVKTGEPVKIYLSKATSGGNPCNFKNFFETDSRFAGLTIPESVDAYVSTWFRVKITSAGGKEDVLDTKLWNVYDVLAPNSGNSAWDAIINRIDELEDDGNDRGIPDFNTIDMFISPNVWTLDKSKQMPGDFWEITSPDKVWKLRVVPNGVYSDCYIQPHDGYLLDGVDLAICDEYYYYESQSGEGGEVDVEEILGEYYDAIISGSGVLSLPTTAVDSEGKEYKVALSTWTLEGWSGSTECVTKLVIPEDYTHRIEGVSIKCDFEVEPGNKRYYAVDGVLYAYGNDGDELVQCPSGKTGSFTIPDAVKQVNNGAFELTHLSQITIGPNLERFESDHEVSRDLKGFIINDNDKFYYEKGLLFGESQLMGGKSIIMGLSGVLSGVVTIPEDVTEIESCALAYETINVSKYVATSQNLILDNAAFDESTAQEFDFSGVGYLGVSGESLCDTAATTIRFPEGTDFLYNRLYLGESTRLTNIYWPTTLSYDDVNCSGYGLLFEVDENVTQPITLHVCKGANWPDKIEIGEDANENTIYMTVVKDQSAPPEWTIDPKGTLLDVVGDFLDANGKMVIPAIIDGVKVTAIAEGFKCDGPEIKEVVIPEGVTHIGSDAFLECGLTSVKIPASVTTMGSAAFGMNPLTKIEVAAGNKNFEVVADGKLLINKTIPGNITTQLALRNVGDLVIPEGVTMIRCDSFEEVIASSITFPSTLTTIEEAGIAALKDVQELNFKNTKLASIGAGAFWDCSATTYRFPDTVTTIGRWAFVSSKKKNVTVYFDGGMPEVSSTTTWIDEEIEEDDDGDFEEGFYDKYKDDSVFAGVNATIYVVAKTGWDSLATTGGKWQGATVSYDPNYKAFAGTIYGFWADNEEGDIWKYELDRRDEDGWMEEFANIDGHKEPAQWACGEGDGFAIPVTVAAGMSVTPQIIEGSVACQRLSGLTDIQMRDMICKDSDWEYDYYAKTLWPNGTTIDTRAWIVVVPNGINTSPKYSMNLLETKTMSGKESIKSYSDRHGITAPNYVDVAASVSFKVKIAENGAIFGERLWFVPAPYNYNSWYKKFVDTLEDNEKVRDIEEVMARGLWLVTPEMIENQRKAAPTFLTNSNGDAVVYVGEEGEEDSLRRLGDNGYHSNVVDTDEDVYIPVLRQYTGQVVSPEVLVAYPTAIGEDVACTVIEDAQMRAKFDIDGIVNSSETEPMRVWIRIDTLDKQNRRNFLPSYKVKLGEKETSLITILEDGCEGMLLAKIVSNLGMNWKGGGEVLVADRRNAGGQKWQLGSYSQDDKYGHYLNINVPSAGVIAIRNFDVDWQYQTLYQRWCEYSNHIYTNEKGDEIVIEEIGGTSNNIGFEGGILETVSYDGSTGDIFVKVKAGGTIRLNAWNDDEQIQSDEFYLDAIQFYPDDKTSLAVCIDPIQYVKLPNESMKIEYPILPGFVTGVGSYTSGQEFTITATGKCGNTFKCWETDSAYLKIADKNAATTTVRVMNIPSSRYPQATIRAVWDIPNFAAGELPLEVKGWEGRRDGANHSISVKCLNSSIYVNVEYSIDGENWSRTNPSFSDVGKYEVFYKVTATGYSNKGSAKVTILSELDIDAADCEGGVKINRIEGTPIGGVLSIPTEIDGKKVVSIEDGALSGVIATSFTIADGHERYTLLDGMLYDKVDKKIIAAPASLTTLRLNEEVEAIGQGAFASATRLSRIYMLGEKISTTGTIFAADTMATIYVLPDEGWDDDVEAGTWQGVQIVYLATADGFMGEYDGKPHTITTSVAANAGASFVYSATKDGYYGPYAPSFTNAGKNTVYYKLMLNGETIGSYDDDVNITPKQLTDAMVKDFEDLEYTGSALTPAAKFNEPLITANDYTLSYANNVSYGTATVTITGKNNFAGTVTKTFKVAKTLIRYTASGYTGVYDGKAHGITINVTKPTTGATITYSPAENSFTNVGEYKVGYGITANNFESVEGKSEIVKITPKALTSAMVTPATITGTFVENGSPFTPAVAVADGELLKASDYDIAYENNVSRGTATIKITAKGNYAGVVTRTFFIKGKMKQEAMSEKPLDEKWNGRWDGKAHGTAIAVDGVEGARVYYRTDLSAAWSASVPTFTEVGEYTIYYKVEANGWETYENSYTVTVLTQYDWFADGGDGIITRVVPAPKGDLVVPEEFDGVKFSGLATELFRGNKELVSITLPETIKTLGDRVFENCENLKSVTFLGNCPANCGSDLYNNVKGVVTYVTPDSTASWGGEDGDMERLPQSWMGRPIVYTGGVVPKDFDVVISSFFGYEDGIGHTISVTAKYPPADMKLYFLVGGEWVAKAPVFKAEGTYEVSFKIMAEGYYSAKGMGTVVIQKKIDSDRITKNPEMPVEYGWLEANAAVLGLPKNPTAEDYEKAALKSTGKAKLRGGTFTAFEEYVMGTNPSNPDSIFQVNVEEVNGRKTLVPSPDMRTQHRVYKYYHKAQLTDSDWEEITEEEAEELLNPDPRARMARSSGFFTADVDLDDEIKAAAHKIQNGVTGGDMDSDGKLSMNDLYRIKDIIFDVVYTKKLTVDQLSPADRAAADVDNDGKITEADVIAILQLIQAQN